MSRIIKFRVWSEEYNCFFFWNGYVFKAKIKLDIGEEELFQPYANWIDAASFGVEQYTGLNGLNNIEIYEGDKFDFDGKIFFVQYVEDRGGYVLTTGKGLDSKNCMDLDCDNIFGKHVIGHIHE